MGNYDSLTCKKLTLFTVSAVMIQIIGLSLFIVGFFPVKPSLSGLRYGFLSHSRSSFSNHVQGLTSLLFSIKTFLSMFLKMFYGVLAFLIVLVDWRAFIRRVSIRLIWIIIYLPCLLKSSNLCTRFEFILRFCHLLLANGYRFRIVSDGNFKFSWLNPT